MNARVKRSRDDAEAQLNEQLAFIDASATAYDRGYLGEAKRIATAVRVLVYDSKTSTSLLSQLALGSIAFFDTAHDYNPRNLLTHMGLVGIQASGTGAQYKALLGDSPRGKGKPVHFTTWWNKVVFVDDRRATLTRGELVLAMANQDGGAHVDPSLDERYARLSRHNSMGWVSEGPAGRIKLSDAHLAAMRQIAFEVQTSFAAQQPAPPDAAVIDKVGRNDRCPCGSGRKYKKCHGAA